MNSQSPLQSVLCSKSQACFLGVAIRCLWNYLTCLFPHVSFGSLQEFIPYVKLKKTTKTLREINWNFLALAFTCCMFSPDSCLNTKLLSFLLWKWTKLKILYMIYLDKSKFAAASLPSSLELYDSSILKGAGLPKEVQGVLISCAMTLQPLKWMKCQPLTCSRVWAGVLPGLLRSSLTEIPLFKAVFKQHLFFKAGLKLEFHTFWSKHLVKGCPEFKHNLKYSLLVTSVPC